MKNILLTLGLCLAMDAIADIEYVAGEQGKATPQEINQSRSCFQELDTQGCGDPGDDIQHFRACLNNVFPRLSTSCKRMMSDLYGAK